MEPTEYVKLLIAEHLGLDASNPNEFGMELDMILDLGADDLDTVEILMEIEEQYSVNMPDWDYKTPQDYVDKLLPLL